MDLRYIFRIAGKVISSHYHVIGNFTETFPPISQMISHSVSPGKIDFVDIKRNVLSLTASGESNLFSLPGNQKSGKQISHLGFLIGHQESTLTKILIFLRFSDKILTH